MPCQFSPPLNERTLQHHLNIQRGQNFLEGVELHGFLPMLNVEYDRFANAGQFRQFALAQAAHPAVFPDNIS